MIYQFVIIKFVNIKIILKNKNKLTKYLSDDDAVRELFIFIEPQRD